MMYPLDHGTTEYTIFTILLTLDRILLNFFFLVHVKLANFIYFGIMTVFSVRFG